LKKNVERVVIHHRKKKNPYRYVYTS
jgi:hypothetical protein